MGNCTSAFPCCGSGIAALEIDELSFPEHLGLERPPGCVGTFLRMIMVNDVYRFDNYPHLASAILSARASARKLDCVVTSHMNGDFLSPCTMTALDGGLAMVEGLNQACIDYVCLGNHEFDIGIEHLSQRLRGYKGKVINSNAKVAQLDYLPRFASIRVGNRQAVFAGIVTGDPSIYVEKNRFSVVSSVDACATAWAEAKATIGKAPDVLVPMTHLLVHEDRALAEELSRHPVLAGKVPALLGGHDHDVFMEKAGESLVLKVGQDSEQIGIVDVWWTADGGMHTAATMHPAKRFAPEPEAAKWAAKQKAFLQGAMEVPIVSLPTACTSKLTRQEPSGLVSFLLSLIKRGLAAQGVELVIGNGGAFRGMADYVPGPFKMGDLYNEISFESEQAVVKMKGQVILDAIKFSRQPPGEKPGFLHVDGDAVVLPNLLISEINKKPFDPNRIYTVSLTQQLLTGLNSIQPLIEWARINEVPDLELCRPAKQIIIEICMKDAWRRLIDSTWDVNKNSDISPQELQAGVSRLMSELDKDKSGRIERAELEQFIRRKGNAQLQLIDYMIKALDTDHDGKLSPTELRSLAH